MTILTRRLAVGLAAAAIAADRGARQRPDQAQMGPCLRDLGALPHASRSGRPRRSRSAPTASYQIDVFPASQLGKETDINQGLSLGTVDMIISGSSFAARSFPPIGVTYYPFTFRDAGPSARLHQERRLQGAGQGLRGQDRPPDRGGDLLRHAPHHLEQADQDLRRHEGPQDPRARRAGLSRHAARLRRQHRADRLRRGLSRAPERHGRGAGEPADHDRGQEVLRGAEAHRPDRPHRRPPQHGRLQGGSGRSSRTRTRRSSPRSRWRRPRAPPQRSRRRRRSSSASSRRRG